MMASQAEQIGSRPLCINSFSNRCERKRSGIKKLELCPAASTEIACTSQVPWSGAAAWKPPRWHADLRGPDRGRHEHLALEQLARMADLRGLLHRHLAIPIDNLGPHEHLALRMLDCDLVYRPVAERGRLMHDR